MQIKINTTSIVSIKKDEEGNFVLILPPKTEISLFEEDKEQPYIVPNTPYVPYIPYPYTPQPWEWWTSLGDTGKPPAEEPVESVITWHIKPSATSSKIIINTEE